MEVSKCNRVTCIITDKREKREYKKKKRKKRKQMSRL
jgi:hypothetical protein